MFSLFKTIILPVIILPFLLTAGTLHVGRGHPHANLQSAAVSAVPGDSIVFHAGVYDGGQFVTHLQGTQTRPITITAAINKEVIIRGGNTAWQLSDPAYLTIRGFIFERQSANGVNLDDGGDYSTPAHNLIFENCIFRDMEASGNNDLLKMSGVDNFTIRNCRFANGAAGGSGIDMVGCHRGAIQGCRFESMGSNAIQAKGGTENITIAANFFRNCGHRSVNLGGSTGLPYFRPADAPFEAAHLYVYANIFIGSTAPIAYVGCVNTHVTNNTIIDPDKWVLRILQETVDPQRFLACGDNFFENNIVYMGNLSTHVNTGPDTRPGSFTFSNNFWYNFENPSGSRPNLPVPDTGMMTGKDPLFRDAGDYHLLPQSPAIGQIKWDKPPELDYDRKKYNNPRSAGAMEGDPVDSVIHYGKKNNKTGQIILRSFPNPFNDSTMLHFELHREAHIQIKIYNISGQLVHTVPRRKFAPGAHNIFWHTRQLSGGVYFVCLETDARTIYEKVSLLR